MSAAPSPSSPPSPALAGLPTHVDFAPSIVFIIAYAFLIPVFVWRFVRPETRTMILLRPGIFLFIRLVTYILRAAIAKGHYSTGLIITETLMLSIGFIMLCLPLTELYSKVVEEFLPSDDRQHWLARIARFLKLALAACLALAIVIASSTSGAITNPTGSTASTVHTLRIALNAILIAIVAIITFAVFRLGSARKLEMRIISFLLVLGALLLVVAAVRLAQAITNTRSTANNSKPIFYIFIALPEWLAAVLLFSFNIVEYFDLHDTNKNKSNYLDSRGEHDMAAQNPIAHRYEA